jgi:hypothetical protein
MIRIPFDRCVIISTLNFAQITERLESAIYDPSFSSSQQTDSSPTNQCYFGQIQGFKFLANRIVGYKYFHLPAFLSPTIEGRIDSLHHGYEISLAIKLHNITVALLLTWLGGLFATLSSVFDNIFTGTKNYQFLSIVQLVAIIYIVIIAYFYFEAWRATKFFRTLFVKKFVGTIEHGVVDRAMWHSNFDLQDVRKSRAIGDLLRKNLPSFPTGSSNPSHSDYPNSGK